MALLGSELYGLYRKVTMVIAAKITPSNSCQNWTSILQVTDPVDANHVLFRAVSAMRSSVQFSSDHVYPETPSATSDCPQ